MVSDPPSANLVQRSDRNEHDTFEGHGKRDVTSKVSNPPSPILFKEVTTTKNPCLLDVQNLSLSEGLRPREGGGFTHQIAFRPRETPLFSLEEEMDLPKKFLSEEELQVQALITVEKVH